MVLSPTNKGSLLVEMCITIALFTIIISYSSLAFSGISQTSTKIESARTTLYNTKETLELALLQEKIQPYTSHPKNIISHDLTRCRKMVSVQELSTLVINSTYNKAIGYDCGGTEPSQLPFRSISSSHVLASTTSFDVLNGIAFVTASSTHDSEPTFYSIDTSTTPISVVSSLNTERGGNAVDVTRNYAYIAAKGNENQFQIIDIQDKYNPQLISQTSLPGVSGSYPSAISIFYYDSKVYIGTHRTAGREFHVFDVSTPSTPEWLGSLEVNHNINDISVRGDYAYLATSGNTKDVIILAISDPTQISIASSISFLGNEDTWSIYLIGTILYAGRAKSTNITHQEIIALSVEDILAPVVVSAYRFNMKVNSLLVAGQTLFTSIVGSKSGLYSINISSLASSTAELIHSSRTPIVDIEYEEGILYSLFQDGVITIYDN